MSNFIIGIVLIYCCYSLEVNQPQLFERHTAIRYAFLSIIKDAIRLPLFFARFEDGQNHDQVTQFHLNNDDKPIKHSSFSTPMNPYRIILLI